MAYMVHANRKPWIFETEKEARLAAQDIFNRKGLIVAISLTDKTATHSYEGGLK